MRLIKWIHLCLALTSLGMVATCGAESFKDCLESDLEEKTGAAAGEARLAPSVWRFITDPNNSAFFAIRLAFETVFLAAGFLFLHLSTWDSSETRDGEDFNPVRLFNFFANPENAVNGVALLVGHTIFASAFLLLPTLFWRGEPLPESSHVTLELQKDASSSPADEDQDRYPLAFRRLLTPFYTARSITMLTIEHLGFITFWLTGPYFAMIPEFFTGRSGQP